MLRFDNTMDEHEVQQTPGTLVIFLTFARQQCLVQFPGSPHRKPQSHLAPMSPGLWDACTTRSLRRYRRRFCASLMHARLADCDN